jgi:ribosomal protein S18 acetylase RimI-like enzyme
MYKIENLSHISLQEVYMCFSQAFFDYEVQIDRSTFENMVKRRAYNPELSFGAFANGKLVSFILNGIDSFNSVITAYDTGTGTVPEHRKKGLVQQIFHHSIPFLKEAGVQQCLLEVIRHNKKAVDLYKKMGFEITRNFNYFVQSMDEIHILNITVPEEITMHEISAGEAEILTDARDFEPSWQNSFKSIERSIEDFKIAGAFSKDELAGYCIFVPASGDLTQIAVKKSFRRKGIATALFKECLKSSRHQSIKILNIEDDCDSINQFLSSLNISLRGKQYEMVKYL